MDKRLQKVVARGKHKDKIIFTTIYPIALFLLNKAIKRKYPRYKVVIVIAPMGQAKYTKIFNRFYNKESKS